MAFELSGIENVGEFYSGHYLSAVLEGDLKATFDAWKEAKQTKGTREPHEALAALGEKFRLARARAGEEQSAAARLLEAQAFHAHLLEALGYPRDPVLEPLRFDESSGARPASGVGHSVVPVHLSLRRDGAPFLWVIDLPFPRVDASHAEAGPDAEDPLADAPLVEQVRELSQDPEHELGSEGVLPRSAEAPHARASWRELLDTQIFTQAEPPRFVLCLAGSVILMVERHKWGQGKFLRFDLGELLGRKDASALRATAGLLHRDVLAPETGVCLHDTLDESSHRHAYAVSGDLKHGVRRSVELLANEAVHCRKDKWHRKVYGDPAFAAKLQDECIRWLYRLLFLFYVEARGGELGVVPMQTDAYRLGYSLEKLRDLELVALQSDHARSGTFIHDTLTKLFSLLDRGFPLGGRVRPRSHAGSAESAWAGVAETGEPSRPLGRADDFCIEALHSSLFDDSRLELLRGVKFRNCVLQEVLQLLSLSAEKKRKQRGRISYAQLGIHQLGSVYEGLLSYTGFFAQEDLYEVAEASEAKKLSEKSAAEREALQTYFVPKSRVDAYKRDEFVHDEEGRKVVHPKGSFVFRLSGRNREKSASYYTPQVLTRCLVKHALKELLHDESGARKRSADDILKLAICEPAMGSSAFLIEAIDQLADAYLKARQEERRERIASEDYAREKRRVMARLAQVNCYGVDLNPTAVELANVSLWLATLHEGADRQAPWFGLRLATGNSLIGARREVFQASDVTRAEREGSPNWLGLAPAAVPLLAESHGEELTIPRRPRGTIYHFLLPAEGMAAFDSDDVVVELAPDDVERVKAWRRDFCAPFSGNEADRLQELSDAVDRLWTQVAREETVLARAVTPHLPVWGEAPAAPRATLRVCEQEILVRAVRDSRSAYRRLELVFDSWCALWFWPIDRANHLPDRASWIDLLEEILLGRRVEARDIDPEEAFSWDTKAGERAEYRLDPQESESDDVSISAVFGPADSERGKAVETVISEIRMLRRGVLEQLGVADVSALVEREPMLGIVRKTTDRSRFHHWPLRFAEIFVRNGGFDLTVGNPPWIKLEWRDPGVLSDYAPEIATRGLSSPATEKLRRSILRDPGARQAYVEELCEMQGSQAFCKENANYRILRGVPVNVYKCFLAKAWEHVVRGGVVALIHPDGIYDNGNGSALRAAAYLRLRYHFGFVNQRKLFREIGNTRRYGINIYGEPRQEPRFICIAGLFHPRTIELSLRHDGKGTVPGIKDSKFEFDESGHRSRAVPIGIRELRIFASFYDADETSPLAARLPVVHSREILSVLSRFAAYPRKFSDMRDAVVTAPLFGETEAQRRGVLRRETSRPRSIWEWVLQGPHLHVGNILYQTPNEICETHRAYTAIDIDSVSPDYIPRTNFLPEYSLKESVSLVTSWRGSPVTEFYRIVCRRGLDPGGERTLIACICPKGLVHIDSCLSIVADMNELPVQAAMLQSLPLDFFVRMTGKGDFRKELVDLLPWCIGDQLARALLGLRALALNCLTPHYSEIWGEIGRLGIQSDSFTGTDGRLGPLWPRSLTWSPKSPLRTDLERRYLLVEIDVLASMVLGLTVEELSTMYRVQFPVLQQVEHAQFYDQCGRIVPTAKTVAGESAVNLVELAGLLKEQAGFDRNQVYREGSRESRDLLGHSIRLSKKEALVLGTKERCTVGDLFASVSVRYADVDHPRGRTEKLLGIRYADPGLEPLRERVYPTPWTRCDREVDYRDAWTEFERRFETVEEQGSKREEVNAPERKRKGRRR